jgi:hypothetical protein
MVVVSVGSWKILCQHWMRCRLVAKTQTQICPAIKCNKLFTLSPMVHIISFVQLGFSSNITFDMVTLTNFVKNFNLGGRLYFNSLVAKPLNVL